MFRPIDTIIVHCSASPDTRDIGVPEITRWHKERGFVTIGYHFVIRRDGTVETGRDLNKIGAHCEGHNMFSIGICWVGETKPSTAQWTALIDLCRVMQKRFAIATSNVKGHREFNPHKTCPNFDPNILRDILSGKSYDVTQL